MKLKTFAWLALLTVTALALAACGGSTVPGSTEPIKVGAIFDETGATSDIGVFYARGVRAYVDWKNENGGIAGRKIDLKAQDYEYKVPKAEELYTQFTTQDKVVVFMGWGTGDTEALRPKITNDKIPFVSASFAGTLTDPKTTPYNFIVAPTYSDQLVIEQQYILDEWKKAGKSGLPKFAYLHSNSPFGKSPLDAGIAHAKANGLADPLAVPMVAASADHTPLLTQIKDYGATHVFIQNVPSPAARALKDAKTMGLTNDVQFICLNYCSHELFIKLAGDAAEGVIGAIPFNPVGAAGAQTAIDYAAKKNINIADGVSGYVQGWWAMAILLEGVERVVKENKPLTGENIKAALETLKGFETGGVAAPISFTADSHAGTKSLKLFKVTGGKWTPLTEVLTAQ